jgi:hypothetical protein
MREPPPHSKIAENVASWLNRPRELVEAVMRPPFNVAGPELIRQLFDDSYIPGLFWIDERAITADFLWDENFRDYRKWLRSIAYGTIELLKAGWPSGRDFSRNTDDLLAESILAVLELPYLGRALSACQTNQQADTIVWRIIKLLVFDDSELDLPTQLDFNDIGRKSVTPILDALDQLTLDEMWKVIVDAGLIGAEIKERSLRTGMTTPGNLRRVIPLETGSGLATPQQVLDQLLQRRPEPLGIDFRQEYFAEVLAPNAKRSVAWLTDDYIETIFDLKFIATQLQIKPNLSVTIIPRDGSYRQDASFLDVKRLLAEEETFAQLAVLHEDGRLHVCPAGPRSSCIDGRMLSREAATHLLESDVVVVKGARSYEMLQGLKKPTYYCLSCSHSFTETLTGLDMDLAQGIILRQDSGMLTYADFKARATRRVYTAGGRQFGVAGMTASEYAAARRSASYQNHLKRFDYRVDDCNAWLLARAEQSGCTFSQVALDAASL